MMAKVGLIMGSISDWPTMQLAAEQLTALGVSYERHVISAHRMPQTLQSYGEEAASRGIQVIIAGAGGAAHLPGMLAANTLLPVIGVPIKTHTLNGVDSLLSIVQMPAGVPVATMAIGDAGAKNGALMAAQIIGLREPQVQRAIGEFRTHQRQEAEQSERQF
ncbi:MULTISPECIES: 5-(carboxyamino)imidazole ribonucleotide mutase [Lactiplantibacillus]|jgi:5-(carboxyamino)imidazole ribonucleotide mutase|uniref:N5-carboxyaminoimidazole ribonucleotide mutase n=1 Tax=Lactiplantibacillus argentoratensis TaxID=271881 RepID=A0AAN1Q231_9LACO|nr:MULTISPECIES: 5-(carboxyamino)imidazole ribonucleotide mutase [Lactiplantibacillus]AYC71888.1 5-(carboxyamino)imidazole ribonucleotide mutase [Lactiplantibacillus plantarum]AYJ36383.1 5-(carboxyamino)imidazole ribonucleotide mutase [Lactiplantibacillus argentoratensis]KON39843.1 N5-carboxyaminoimidazole ribonucleotide mutase [Lactiplantibacillus plantarum]KRL98394.1 phosphoribosylaminoimidazole carboxylase, catalytic subunit [Lactiplantibacillus argentoratensis DSM 16365]KTF00689.1 Phosphor